VRKALQAQGFSIEVVALGGYVVLDFVPRTSMTREELFLFTVEDLDDRLQLGKGEYDALGLAWLLRKLLLNGQRSLLSLVAEGRDVDPSFTVLDHSIPMEPVYFGSLPLVPFDDDDPRIVLGHQAFLRHPAAQVVMDSERSAMRTVPVSDLIAFLANVEGAVHLSRPNERWQEALWLYCWSATTVTPKGQYSSGVASLIQIAQVTREGIEPLRAEIFDEVWAGRPEWIRGLVRSRDPRNFGWPSPTQ
jgi:hypothetical protein